MATVRNRTAIEQSQTKEVEIDTRSFSEKLQASLKTHKTASMAAIAAPIIGGLMALTSPIAALVGLPFIYVISRKYFHPNHRLHNMPLAIPQHLKLPDGRERVPSDTKLNKDSIHRMWGKGISFLGHMRDDLGLQVWLNKATATTHMTIIGTTGSGKTETILTLLLNQMLEDSGFIFVDGKGDASVMPKVNYVVRRVDRDEDILVLNFGGSADPNKNLRSRETNTFNMMASSPAAILIEILSGMVSTSEAGSDMWEGRCLSYLAALTRPLVYLRDQEMIDLAPATYNDFMELTQVERFVHDSPYPPEIKKGLKATMGALDNFLQTLPGYSPNKLYQQETKTNEQFGYVTMQLTRVFNDLSYNYGHIFGSKVGEIDITDVVLNRRCLVILLPALERSDSTLKMLGRLIMSGVRQMIATALGRSLEGSRDLNIDSLPSSSKNMFRVVLDELGYYIVPGLAVIAAQSRSVNIAMTYAMQSYADLTKSGSNEAESIWDNCRVKMIGKIVTSSDSQTWGRVKGLAGEIRVAEYSGYEKKEGLFGSIRWKASGFANQVLKPRVKESDIQGQEQGQFHIFVPAVFDGGREVGNQEMLILPVQMFWAREEWVGVELALNDLVPISKVGAGKALEIPTVDFTRVLESDGSVLTKYHALYNKSGNEQAGVESKSALLRFMEYCHEQLAQDTCHGLFEKMYSLIADEFEEKDRSLADLGYSDDVDSEIVVEGQANLLASSTATDSISAYEEVPAFTPDADLGYQDQGFVMDPRAMVLHDSADDLLMDLDEQRRKLAETMDKERQLSLLQSSANRHERPTSGDE
ncbi:type IV secretory system conjugative DNA transfer family protein [Moraxella sp. ZJ142]|uniref:type IV secretory system conjugative DNA transfer family protein n=1 Tax=Moraxella marmotae TaxID=3344520 RepID=UPI0035D527D7